MTLPRLAGLAVALRAERMTVARIPTARPDPMRDTMRTSTLPANRPMSDAPSRTTMAMTLSRR